MVIPKIVHRDPHSHGYTKVTEMSVNPGSND